MGDRVAAFGDFDAAWMPDAMCGRTVLNVALELTFRSIRTFCPVTCGCEQDTSADCPKVCAADRPDFQAASPCGGCDLCSGLDVYQDRAVTWKYWHQGAQT